MKPETLLGAMGGIREEWIEDAETGGKATPLWLRLGAVAVVALCLCGVFAMVWSHLRPAGEAVTQGGGPIWFQAQAGDRLGLWQTDRQGHLSLESELPCSVRAGEHVLALWTPEDRPEEETAGYGLRVDGETVYTFPEDTVLVVDKDAVTAAGDRVFFLRWESETDEMGTSTWGLILASVKLDGSDYREYRDTGFWLETLCSDGETLYGLRDAGENGTLTVSALDPASGEPRDLLETDAEATRLLLDGQTLLIETAIYRSTAAEEMDPLEHYTYDYRYEVLDIGAGEVLHDTVTLEDRPAYGAAGGRLWFAENGALTAWSWWEGRRETFDVDMTQASVEAASDWGLILLRRQERSASWVLYDLDTGMETLLVSRSLPEAEDPAAEKRLAYEQLGNGNSDSLIVALGDTVYLAGEEEIQRFTRSGQALPSLPVDPEASWRLYHPCLGMCGGKLIHRDSNGALRRLDPDTGEDRILKGTTIFDRGGPVYGWQGDIWVMALRRNQSGLSLVRTDGFVLIDGLMDLGSYDRSLPTADGVYYVNRLDRCLHLVSWTGWDRKVLDHDVDSMTLDEDGNVYYVYQNQCWRLGEDQPLFEGIMTLLGAGDGAVWYSGDTGDGYVHAYLTDTGDTLPVTRCRNVLAFDTLYDWYDLTLNHGMDIPVLTGRGFQTAALGEWGEEGETGWDYVPDNPYLFDGNISIPLAAWNEDLETLAGAEPKPSVRLRSPEGGEILRYTFGGLYNRTWSRDRGPLPPGACQMDLEFGAAGGLRSCAVWYPATEVSYEELCALRTEQYGEPDRQDENETLWQFGNTALTLTRLRDFATRERTAYNP